MAKNKEQKIAHLNRITVNDTKNIMIRYEKERKK